MGEWKDAAIKMAREQADAQRLQDTLIQQKVGAAHRAAFREKFPGQVEHCLRLTAERLQRGLNKESEQPVSDAQARDLSAAVWNLYQVYRDLAKD